MVSDYAHELTNQAIMNIFNPRKAWYLHSVMRLKWRPESLASLQ